MEHASVVRKMLWATTGFAEIGALAAFLLSEQTIVLEITGGQPMVMGMELLVLAGLSAYAALRKTVSKRLIWFIAALNGLLFIFLASRLADAAVSDLSKELIALDMVAILALSVGLVMNSRPFRQHEQVALTSGT